MVLAGAFLISVAVSCLLAFFLSRKAHKLDLIDIPNGRSSHLRPTPKGGGIAIVAGVFLTLTILALAGLLPKNYKIIALLLGALAMAFLGYASDRFNISARLRLVVQFIIAISVVFAMTRYPNVGIVAAIFYVFWLVSVTNFYNFMDGIDGLAALQGVVAGLALVAFGVVAGDFWLIPLGAALVAGCMGFGFLNMPPAKIFMGDVGSYFIGFYIAATVLMGHGLFMPIALTIGVFLFDTIVTLFTRIAKGEPWHEAHRSHFYQRAAHSGLGHGVVTGWLFVVYIFLALMGFVYLTGTASLKITVVVSSLFLLCGLGALVMIIEKKKKA